MIRRLSTGISVPLLLLCVATVALWVRSYWVNDRVELTVPPHLYAIEAERGCVYVRLYDAGTKVEHADIVLSSDPVADGEGWENIPHHRWAGVQLFGDQRFLMISLWLPTVLAAGCGAFLFRRATAVPVHGVCASCGYDLRASKGRCPECGTPISSHTRTHL
ncbi:MAG TPA: hypothetical protein VGI81_02875 [Tepidisphaeraceae bacterium]